jgi:flagellar FliJ protein
MKQKGFQFKLEAVLKVRKFAEEKKRIEMGYIQKLVNEKINEIDNEQEEVKLIHSSHDGDLKSGLKGYELALYPMYLKAKNEKIKQLRRDLRDLEMALSESKDEWNKTRADLKVVEKLKEKELSVYNKAKTKKENLQLEEDVMIWLASRERRA